MNIARRRSSRDYIRLTLDYRGIFVRKIWIENTPCPEKTAP